MKLVYRAGLVLGVPFLIFAALPSFIGAHMSELKTETYAADVVIGFSIVVLFPISSIILFFWLRAKTKHEKARQAV